MPNNWPDGIEHVVVLMMENRSFDHLLGDYTRINPACDGINRNAPSTNPLKLANGNSTVITQASEFPENYSLWAPPPPLPPTLPPSNSEGFDLGHEFVNVEKQLGVSFKTSPANPKLDGFAQDAYDKARKDLNVYKTWSQSMAQRAMNYIPLGAKAADDTLPAIHGLARNFTVCDRWFSSVPGPTWPNRFFAMLGSCNGHLLMPSTGTVLAGIKSLIAQFGGESIFSLLRNNGHDARIYSDGAVPLAALVKGGLQHLSIDDFKSDVAGNKLPELSWIEPSYGLLNGKLGPNVSHHPPEDLRFGDQFVGEVFNALSGNTAVWNKTLFVLLYDEHGGFHDHVVPPTCVATGSTADVPWKNPFTRLGVRVPAILASPWLKPGLIPWTGNVQAQHYDHTSLLAFLCDHFKLPRSALGPRVIAAQHFGNAPIWRTAPGVTAAPKLAATLVPSRAGLPLIESELATQSRQVVDSATGYLDGLDPEQIWKSSAQWVSGFLGNRSRALADPAQAALTPAAPSADSLEAKLRRLQDLMITAQGQAVRPVVAPASKALVEPGSEIASTRLRVLCLPGVGFTPADKGLGGIDGNWQEQWRTLIRNQLAQNGRLIDDQDIDFLCFDEQLKEGPDFAQITRGLAMLRADASGKADENFGSWGLPVNQMLRTTVGAIVQWIEDAELRTELTQHLLTKIEAFNPQIIFAQGLGSLIGYDALRRSVAKKGSALKRIDGRVFVSFGSPIALPLVMREVWGGRVLRLSENGRGIRRWFHLYNPNDGLLTRPITSPDSARVDLQTEFSVPLRDDLLDLNHAAQAYLSSPTSQTSLWPQLARDVVAARALEVPAFLSRSGQRKRRALVVGINDYPDPSARLDGCINDTYLISRMLQESGYDAGDIRLLHDARATRANFVERLEWLVEGARAGDERVLFYSGHGTQLPVYSSSGEADCMDETLVLHDFDWDDESTHFTDKLFRQFYSHLPFDPDGHGAKLTVMFDCCYAGGMTRGNGRVRGITPPSDIRHRMLRWDPYAGDWDRRVYAVDADRRDFSEQDNKTRGLTRTRTTQGAATGLRPEKKAQLLRQGKLYGHHGPYMPLMLYAARENEKANEYEVGSNSYGAFTYALVEQLRKLHQEDATLGFDQLIERVGSVLSARSLGQTPEIVGPSGVRAAVCPWRISGLGK
ncbi:alkaline phosphatase family protein [Pseudomonas baetica]|uniref:alkaline phosphatase family protein n=1 Tax=Pseudomonas baetica TaxID=674054 RepID=UPI00240555DE|nr:alkaline phosphatase family protein [Pseudomonas baetica]MDF9774702.1 phospholipase C [Pseudomonas baetica]